MSIDGGAIGLKLAIEVIKRPASRGILYVYTKLTGVKVLVVGEGRAGKTSFVDYLTHGILLREQVTPKTIDEHESAAFRIKIGRDENLQLKVSKVLDESGQVGAVEHAKVAEARKPQVILVLLDLSAPVTGDPSKASGTWLTDFCKHLDHRLREGRGLKRRLKAIMFIANKYDKLTPEAAEKKIQAFRKIIQKYLEPSYATAAENLPVLPCISIETEKGTKLIDEVIVQLAKALER